MQRPCARKEPAASQAVQGQGSLNANRRGGNRSNADRGAGRAGPCGEGFSAVMKGHWEGLETGG